VKGAEHECYFIAFYHLISKTSVAIFSSCQMSKTATSMIILTTTTALLVAT